MSRYFQPIKVQMLAASQHNINFLRLYGRWTHRNPAKVILPFEPSGTSSLKKEKVIDLDPEILNKSQTKDPAPTKSKKVQEASKRALSTDKCKEIKERKSDNLKKRKFYLNQQKVFNDNGEILYEKLKENDSKISSLLVGLKSKKERSRSGLTLVEGWRLIVDGLEANCSLKYVIFSQVEDINNLRPFLPKTGVKLYKIPYKEIELWSDVETSPGIFGVFETPTPENIRRLSKPLPLQFVCDNIRIPGNLGAILRAAVGAGCEKVILTKGCVDVWDPKVIRSAAGAHFRLPLHCSVEWSDMTKFLEPESSILVADSNTKVNTTEDSDKIDEDNVMPVLPYYGIEFSKMKHITLILGGETEGISEESYRLAASRGGVRLNIPLEKGVDSLNTGMATAVIAFEIKKQIIQAWSKRRLEMKMAT